MNKLTTDLIKHFESLHDGNLKKVGLQPKMDPILIWTEGWGRAMVNPLTKKFLKGPSDAQLALKYQTIFTIVDADAALIFDLVNYAKFAEGALGKDVWKILNDNAKGALTSFIYNCGIGKPPYKIWKNVPLYASGKMSKDDLIKYWESSVIKGGGVILKGLIRRRAAEAKLFFS